MVKTYHVRQFIRDGIRININNCEDMIISEYSNKTPNSFEVEFTDLSIGSDKTKYRITIESVEC